MPKPKVLNSMLDREAFNPRILSFSRPKTLARKRTGIVKIIH